ncbi:MAG: beta-galactosidase, partial [Clostridia bacterium]|nr:beta-galactosidase [Clostridia bacterium]
INLTEENLSGRVFLHIGASDYETDVWVNDTFVGKHKGGYTSFAFDITNAANIGDNLITIRALDDTRSCKQPSGKQSHKFKSFGCYYTRTTGIWQSVWLEFVPENYIKNFRFYTDVENASVTAVIEAKGNANAEMSVFYEGRLVGTAKTENGGDNFTLSTALSEKHLWELGKGRLYDVTIKYGEDVVKSYFGLRTATMSGNKFLLNGKSVYQRLVLDQGFYPDGVYTAPTEQDLINDIKISMDAGFNGARLHEKVFEPRFLYNADKMGYMVWGEYPNWGFDYTDDALEYLYVKDWIEAISRDFNHPAIVCWCPFNETWNINDKPQDDEILRLVYNATKAADTTRPCVDTSGNYHVVTDIYDLHDYCQNIEDFEKHCKEFSETGKPWDNFPQRQQYRGEPLAISEYGGISLSSEGGWGYGNAAKNLDEFYERYTSLTTSLLNYKECFSFCYTQLYDVEQEINGIYTYDRKPKCDISKIYAANTQKAAIED